MTEVTITVECKVTGQNFDFNYDDELTLAQFIIDLQSSEPPMGFDPADATIGNLGVIIAGDGYEYIGNETKTLAELGVVANSYIQILEGASSCGPSPTYRTPSSPTNLVKKERPRLKIKSRKSLIKLSRPTLSRVEPSTLNGIDLVRTCALNNWRGQQLASDQFTRVQQLRDWLISEQDKGSLRTAIPERFKDKEMETIIGDLPFENFVIWCSNCDTLPKAAIHALITEPSLEKESPNENIIMTLGNTCGEPNCSGVIGLWDYATVPPR